MSELCHALFTNAFGRRGEGFRHLFLAPSWPGDDKQRISRWLELLKPDAASSSEADAVAVNCFRIGRTIHAALARVDAAFARDEHGRAGGILVHALLVPLVEGETAGAFTAALLAHSREQVRPDVDHGDRLEAYLAQCRGSREIAVPEPAVDELLALDPGFLERFFALAARPGRGGGEAALPLAGEDLAEGLANAVGWLPPRLRLACRWAVGLQPVPMMSFVARPSPAAADSTSPAGDLSLVPLRGNGPGAAFARRLLSRAASGRGGEVIEMSENWEVRSWEDLMEWIR